MDKRENLEHKQNLGLQHVQPSNILPHRFFIWIKHIYLKLLSRPGEKRVFTMILNKYTISHEKDKLKTLSKVSGK